MLALWTAFAHSHDAFQVSPLLTATSPEPGCGKTSLLMLLGALTPRPLPTANITTASLFRVVQKYRPCVLVDEADTFIGDNDELRGVLNSGWLRSSAVVVRTVGDDHEPRLFSTWAPKAVALIGKLPATLADRSIEIKLRRQLPEEERRTQKLRGDRLHEFEPLRRRAWRWAQDNLEALQCADPEVPSGLANRRADNWRPLLAVAELAGGPWPERAREAARTFSVNTNENESLGVMLLGDLKALFDERGVDRMPSLEVAKALGEMEERPWPEFNHGRPISQRGVAKLLGRFGVVPRTIRLAGATPKGYLLVDLADSFARFLHHPTCESATTPQLAPGAPSSDLKFATHDTSVADENVENLMKNQPCGAVADKKGRTPRNEWVHHPNEREEEDI